MNRYRIRLVVIDDQMGRGVVEEGDGTNFADLKELLDLMYVSAKGRLTAYEEEKRT